MIIAIDGPAAAGKGTIAERLAAHYRIPYLDTGLLYRAIGRAMADKGLDLADNKAAGQVAANIDLTRYTGPDLRGREAGELASQVAVHKTVRDALLKVQRDFAKRPGGAVLDGRDIGTTVCPEADVKIFVTASSEVRARRRTEELRSNGRTIGYKRILAEIAERDTRDSERAVAPLRPATDAYLLDTTDKDIETAFRAAVDIVERAKAERD